MRRSWVLHSGEIVGALLLLAGCGAEPAATPTTAQTTATAAASPTVTAHSYDKSDVDAAALRLDDLNLVGFHSYTFPPPNPSAAPDTDPCAIKWGHRFDDDGRTATVNSDQISFAMNDNVGPFIFQQQTIQPGTGAADIVAAVRKSYLGTCATWTNVTGFKFNATEQTDVGSFGDHSFAYHVAISDGKVNIEVMGIYMSKGNLLSHVEYAGSPSISASKAKSVLAAAGKLLPST